MICTPLEKKAVKALMKCVAGYTAKEVKSTYEVDKENGIKYIKSEVITTKTVPPELSAIIFALTNLNPAKWKAKPEASAGEKDSPGDPVDLKELSEATLKELSGYFERIQETKQSAL